MSDEPKPSPDDSKWDAFETWKGPPSNIPPWAERLLKWFVSAAALVLLFSVSAVAVWLAFYFIVPKAFRTEAVAWEPDWFSQARFFGGGLFGTGFVLWWIFVRNPEPESSTTRRKRRRTRRK